MGGCGGNRGSGGNGLSGGGEVSRSGDSRCYSSWMERVFDCWIRGGSVVGSVEARYELGGYQRPDTVSPTVWGWNWGWTIFLGMMGYEVGGGWVREAAECIGRCRIRG